MGKEGERERDTERAEERGVKREDATCFSRAPSVARSHLLSTSLKAKAPPPLAPSAWLDPALGQSVMERESAVSECVCVCVCVSVCV